MFFTVVYLYNFVRRQCEKKVNQSNIFISYSFPSYIRHFIRGRISKPYLFLFLSYFDLQYRTIIATAQHLFIIFVLKFIMAGQIVLSIKQRWRLLVLVLAPIILLPLPIVNNSSVCSTLCKHSFVIISSSKQNVVIL